MCTPACATSPTPAWRNKGIYENRSRFYDRDLFVRLYIHHNSSTPHTTPEKSMSTSVTAGPRLGTKAWWSSSPIATSSPPRAAHAACRQPVHSCQRVRALSNSPPSTANSVKWAHLRIKRPKAASFSPCTSAANCSQFGQSHARICLVSPRLRSPD